MRLVFPKRHGRGRQKPPRGSMIDWESSFARSLGFYCNFDTIGPPSTAPGRPFCQDKVTGMVASAATASTESSALFDLGAGVEGFTSINDGFLFGAAGTFGTLQDIANYCRSDSVFTVACKVRPFDTTVSPRVAADIFCQDTATGTGTWALSMRQLETVAFATADVDIAISANGYRDGRWYSVFGIHLPAVTAGGTNTLYVFDGNGVMLETVSVSTTVSPSSGTIEPICFCRAAVPGISGELFRASLEWGSIWKRALEQSEMAALASDPYQFLLPAGNNRRIGGKVVVSATNPRFRALTGVGK